MFSLKATYTSFTPLALTIFILVVPQLLQGQTRKEARIITSAKNGNIKLQEGDKLTIGYKNQPLETEISIFLDTTKLFQEFIGIGAAITDASAETFAKVNKETQQKLIEAFYHPLNGLGYTIVRTNMNSCDFSCGSYTYVKEGDKDLKSFSIEHDKQFKLPLIQAAQKTIGAGMKLYISPWSPPAFMKDNQHMLRGGKLLPAYYQPWANYYIKYIQALEKEGIPVWGLSVQNEPMAVQKWESCIYTSEEERDFVKKFLGPTLHAAGMQNKKLIVWDHNRDMIVQRTTTILSDPDAAKYVWGVGYHWYENWSGGEQMYDNLGLVNNLYPDKKLFFTEGCKESFKANKYEDWSFGEFYAKAMIKDFNNGLCGFTDWNVFLDETGGPNHVGNFCFAPVHVNTKTNEIYYTNAYQYIGHFSKYIQLGAKRITCSASRSALMATAFKNVDGSIVVVVMNQGEKELDYQVQLGTLSIPVKIPAHGIQTLIF
jgi:glucosylceramidase